VTVLRNKQPRVVFALAGLWSRSED